MWSNLFAFMESPVVKNARLFVEDYFLKNKCSGMYYHNPYHTREVVGMVKTIAREDDLTADQLETALLAAWFHDTGYCSTFIGHESESIRLASDFLQKQQCPQEKTETVIGCILATMVPQTPKNIAEMVVCDADLSHLGSYDYFIKAENLRKELSATSGNEISEQQWLSQNRMFFETHRFFTNYGTCHLEKRKQINYDKILARLNARYPQPDGKFAAD